MKNYPIIGIISISILISLIILWVVYFNKGMAPFMSQPTWIPPVNAAANFLSAVFLVMAIYQIKVKANKQKHITLISISLFFSALFLIFYLLYHLQIGHVPYQRQGAIRYYYFFILITHILASIINLPMILTTLYYAKKKRWDLHKRVARKTYPLWLYVSITGVIVFIFQLFNE